MNKIFTILIIFISNLICAQELEIIISTTINKENDIYENSIEKYKNSEFWGAWTMPIGEPFSSSELAQEGNDNYSVSNLSDYDLNTAWVENKTDYGIRENFGFVFNFPENTEYGGAYQFFGQINLFNGYCKSINTWEDNSRIKKIKVYYNENPICIVKLVDTWHFQHFDIGKFFKNERENKYMNAAYEIKEGDKLIFEIIEIYPGLKYKDTAVSEFMAEGAGN